jgi:hypothetical protein
LAAVGDPVIAETGKISSSAERSDFLVKKTFDFIKGNPKKVFVLELEKIIYFWAPFDWEIVGGRWFNFIYVTVFPFFVFGLFLGLRQLDRSYVVLLPIIYCQIMALIFYGSPRFRLPIEPYVFILGGLGILHCLRLHKKAAS